MKKFIKSIFFTRRLYQFLAAIALVFIVSYAVKWLFILAMLLLLLFVLLVIFDTWILYRNTAGVQVARETTEMFSNGDENTVSLSLQNHFPFTARIAIVDEVPVEVQLRDFILHQKLEAAEKKSIQYFLRPVKRGEYSFGNINIFVQSPLQIIIRRLVIPAEKTITVMPSYQNLRKYQLLAQSSSINEAGSSKIRKIGHSLEFEQIRDYVLGDDIRSINWKATARKGGHLMVNNFVDERSQQVYCLIDKSRVMKMPFDGMTLLDYAINSSLALSQVALIRHDKAGIIAFDENMGTILPAERRGIQMSRIMEALYNLQTRFLDSDYEKLHLLVRRKIPQRSLLVLFTNFESFTSLQRQLPFLRSLAKYHLLLVVFFENTGLKDLIEVPAENTETLYIRTIAEKFAYEKRLMIGELNKYGIMAILTEPQHLTINTVNKYLELKASLKL